MVLLEAGAGQNLLFDRFLRADEEDPGLGTPGEEFARDGDGGKQVTAAAAAGQEVSGRRGQRSEDRGLRARLVMMPRARMLATRLLPP